MAEINNAIDRTPPKKYIEAVGNLTSFINNVEGVLLSEHVILSDEKTMEEQTRRFQDIQSSLKEQEEIFKYVNSTGQDLIEKINDDSSAQRLKDELQDLNTKWSDIPIILEEKQQALTKGEKKTRNMQNKFITQIFAPFNYYVLLMMIIINSCIMYIF